MTLEVDDKYKHEKRVKCVRQKRAKTKFVEPPTQFINMPCVAVDVEIPSKEKRAEMRRDFDMNARKAFLKYLAQEQQKDLILAGFTRKEIDAMSQGKTPNGWNTHHKQSIFCGGTNDFSNLILIRKDPYHDMLHYHLINPQLQNMQEGDKAKVVLPMPTENIYVPTHAMRTLERDAAHGKKTFGPQGARYIQAMLLKGYEFAEDVVAANKFINAIKNQRGR
ncbi:MAG: hypothetical protein MJ247_00295 [Alphaproteobacteria bacterium]|nr:hypothetical protein [Alphaproteobacteria bacterium]